MVLALITPPTEEPLTLTEAKLHLRLAVTTAQAVNYPHEDALLSRLISSVREQAEGETWRRFITQTWDYYLDSWPDERFIRIPNPPLQSASLYYSIDGDSPAETEFTDIDTDIYSTPGRLVLQRSATWPVGTLIPSNGIRIRLRCGYGTADDVPIGLKAALLIMLSDLYENRGSVIVGTNVTRITRIVDNLLNPFRANRL